MPSDLFNNDCSACLNNLFNKYISFGQCNKNQSKIYQNFICGKTCAVTTVCTSLFFILDDWLLRNLTETHSAVTVKSKKGAHGCALGRSDYKQYTFTSLR